MHGHYLQAYRVTSDRLMIGLKYSPNTPSKFIDRLSLTFFFFDASFLAVTPCTLINFHLYRDFLFLFAY